MLLFSLGDTWHYLRDIMSVVQPIFQVVHFLKSILPIYEGVCKIHNEIDQQVLMCLTLKIICKVPKVHKLFQVCTIKAAALSKCGLLTFINAEISDPMVHLENPETVHFISTTQHYCDALIWVGTGRLKLATEEGITATLQQ